jgi:hypothetical protein
VFASAKRPIELKQILRTTAVLVESREAVPDINCTDSRFQLWSAKFAKRPIELKQILRTTAVLVERREAVQRTMSVLDGELAVPCNPESALPGLKSHLRA